FGGEQLKQIINERTGRVFSPMPAIGEVEYDILPTGPKAWDGFLLYKSQITLWHCTQQPRGKNRFGVSWLPVESKKCSEPIAAGPGRWLYFALSEQPEPRPFDRGAVKVEAEEPLKAALTFARFLLHEGQLKAK